MKHSISFLLTFCLACLFTVQAQLVEVSYQVSEQQVRIYLQSTSSAPVALRAVNLSMAFADDATVEAATPSLFRQSWSEYLEEQRQIEGLKLSYDQLPLLSQRLQYGNAEPGLATTEAITVPGNNEDPLLVMELKVTGNAQNLYLEHQSENPLNQLGGMDMEPIDYVIVHPQRQGAVEEGLTGSLDFVLYPNPASERITLRLSGERNQAWQYNVADLLGRVLLRGDLPADLPNGELTLQLRNWAEGTYYVSLTSETGENLVRKFVVK